MKNDKVLLILVMCLNFTHQFDMTPIGVPPELTSLYSGETFECFDKSNSIAFYRVNDDYCDCNDSSDEPGTSACRNSRFYCRNKNYIPKFIPGNFVNDGFCDCCDGSDEYISKNCTDNCLQLADHLNVEKNRLFESYEKGYSIYRNFIEDIDHKLQIKKENDYKKFVEKRMEEKRQKAEKEEMLMKEKEREAAEKRKETEETEKAKNSMEVETTSDDEFDPEKEAERQLKDEDSESSSQEIPPHEDFEFKDDEEEQNKENEDEEFYEKTSEIDYGPNNSFLMLALNDPIDCYELTHEEYIYKLCPFQNVYQILKGGGSQTNIGNWNKWLVKEHSGSEPLVMHYNNGQTCWQGPARSTKVKIICGDQNRITSASEPSRCEYLLTMESPAACYLPPHELLNNYKLSHDEL